MTPRLDLSDLQGNVLRPFGFEFGWHQFVRIDDPAEARKWLGRLAEDYVSDANPTTASKPNDKSAVNVALSAAAVAALGAPNSVLAQFSPEFRKGMAARADILGDRGHSDPEGWRPGFKPSPLVLVSAYGDDKSLEPVVTQLRWECHERTGLTEVHSLNVQRFKDGREHFGFADGFGQPEIAGAPPARRAALRGAPLPAGEFLIGHRDIEYAIAPGPAGPLGRNGTYLVYRELAQDVGTFRDYVADQAHRTGLDSERIEAKMVGRWPGGSPLINAPERPDPAMTPDDGTLNPEINDFTYEGDPDGEKCPLGAHIRRVNPRDALGFPDRDSDRWQWVRRAEGKRMSRRHRMMRRGMPYGPRYDDCPKAERGLAFICLVASIERQFEFVQAQWCNDGNAFGLGVERDALVGHNPTGGSGPRSKVTIPGTPPCFLWPAPGVVHTRGGEYFFLPSLTGLRMMSTMRWF